LAISWTEVRSKFKSPMRVVGPVLWRSRENKKAKCHRLKLRLVESLKTIARRDAEIQRQQEEIRELRKCDASSTRTDNKRRGDARCRKIRR
jgi:hypothetical protein